MKLTSRRRTARSTGGGRRGLDGLRRRPTSSPRGSGGGGAWLPWARPHGSRRPGHARAGRAAAWSRTAMSRPGRGFAAARAGAGGRPADRRSDRPARRPAQASPAGRVARAAAEPLVVLLSDLLDPNADKVIRELAATGSELIVMHVLSPDELDPRARGRPSPGRQRDRRGDRRDRRPGDASTPTRRASRHGRRTSPTSPRSAARATSTCRPTRTSRT